ncbi:MAG TPA: hypothetical protein VHJ20_11035 [Polyangia bacterium]|nr:hypothetical protein [Polyangia bacterium]
MTSPAETVRVALAALMAGVAIPLLVQLFFVLRNVRRTTAVLDRRLDQTLSDLGDVVAEIKRVSVPAPSLAAQLAAAVPAIVAAVHAFRTGFGHDVHGAAPTDNHHHKEKTT